MTSTNRASGGGKSTRYDIKAKQPPNGIHLPPPLPPPANNLLAFAIKIFFVFAFDSDSGCRKTQPKILPRRRCNNIFPAINSIIVNNSSVLFMEIAFPRGVGVCLLLTSSTLLSVSVWCLQIVCSRSSKSEISNPRRGESKESRKFMNKNVIFHAIIRCMRR